jgi:uncharacterized membrane protein
VTFPARHISVSIRRPPADVYAFASEPANLPRWASGLSSGIEEIDGEWVAESPMGRVRVALTARNDLGVLDHDVTLPSGETVHNPMRVLANGDGSEVVFTLYRRPGVSDAEYEADAAAVAADLERLKALLEA